MKGSERQRATTTQKTRTKVSTVVLGSQEKIISRISIRKRWQERRTE